MNFLTNYLNSGKTEEQKQKQKQEEQEEEKLEKPKEYDSSIIKVDEKDEQRLSDYHLGVQAENKNLLRQKADSDFNKQDSDFANTITDRIKRQKNIRFAAVVVTEGAKAALKVIPLPGASLLCAALNMAQTLAAAVTTQLKFKELMYDTMIILTNCYKIYALVNRATDTFLIAIHNRDGLKELYNYRMKLIEQSKQPGGSGSNDSNERTETGFLQLFQTLFDDAITRKTKNRKNIDNDLLNNPYYLLYNIHQGADIKREIDRKMKNLMTLLLESAPDDVILTLFLDTTIAGTGIDKLVEVECIKRKEGKSGRDICFNPKKDEQDAAITTLQNIDNAEDIKRIEEAKNNRRGILSSIRSGFNSTTSSIKKNIGNFVKNSYELSVIEEKMFEALTDLSVINGLFIVMKAQYDEAMRYYEKHLDFITETSEQKVDSNNLPINQLIRGRNSTDTNKPTIFEMTTFLIEISPEYINFMVPPKLQDTITQSINTGEKAKAYKVLKTLSEEESKSLMEENEKRLKDAEAEAQQSTIDATRNGGSRPKKTLGAVKYYLKHNDSMDKVCEIFDCKKSTLKGWIDRYRNTKNITRKNRKPISYKINKEQVRSAVNMIDKNEQLTMDELLFSMKQKYKDLDITRRHLGRVIRANNRTRKRTRHQYYPKERRK